MQILIDAIRLQKQRGFNHNRTIIGTIKDNAEALKEAAEQIRCVISECIDRNLPIDDALAKLHFAELTKQEIDYNKIIELANSDKIIAIKSARTRQAINHLVKIHEAYEKHSSTI